MKQISYFDEAHRGTMRRLDYVGAQGARKYALIYLPYGYDDDLERRYPILYLMHGGLGNPDAWPDSCPIKNALDRGIAAGEVTPMIAVFPSFYVHGSRPYVPGHVDTDFEHGSVLTFQKEELTQRLLPAVEGAVRGYAEGVSPEALKAARKYRGFGGFSMGGVNTRYAFSLHLDYFSTFLPLSGDSWAMGVKGGSDKPAETAAQLRECALASGVAPEDFAIFAATGTKDIAYPNMLPQIEAMKALDDVFRFSEDYGQGNLHWLAGEDMVHSYSDAVQYVYNFLPWLFRF